MKTKLTLLCGIALLSLTVACKKLETTPSTSTSTDAGSWSYNGLSFAGTFSAWTGNTFQASADKPRSSNVQAYFSSNNPSAGTYNIVPSPSGGLASNEVTIALVDGKLPGISYLTAYNVGAKATVTRSGSGISVSISNAKVYAEYTSGMTVLLDSVAVTGTIKK